MKVGLIGAGKVGLSLALLAKRRGARLVGVLSRSAASQARGADMLAAPVSSSPGALLRKADVLFIAVPDDSIAACAQGLAREISSESALSAPLCGKTVCHFSGALSSDVLAPLAELGANVFSVHPPLSFADVLTDISPLESLTFTVEGRGDSSAVAELFVRLRHIRPEDKGRYHAALCILSNFTVTLAAAAEEFLEGLDVGFSDFLPLIYGTLGNIARRGAKRSLTGPAARGDAGTIRLHLEQLPDCEAKKLYTEMTQQTARLALREGYIQQEAFFNILSALRPYQESNGPTDGQHPAGPKALPTAKER